MKSTIALWFVVCSGIRVKKRSVMQLKFLHRVFILAIFISGCTDSRLPNLIQRGGITPGRSFPAGISPIMSVRFDQQTTITTQMVVSGPTLFLVGRPFGFSLWDVGTNPLSPRMQYAFSDNIQAFSQMGGWTPDNYASGAVGVRGNYVLTSGAAGASLIDTTDKNAARELFRYPPRSGSEISVPMDPWFVYRAIIPHPTQPYFYGFREQDVAVALSVSGSGLNIQNDKLIRYQARNSGTCCVLGGITYRDKIFVAFRAALRQFAFLPDGGIAEVSENTNLNAVNVASSGDYLFVQHQAVPGNTYPSGIYVINESGNSVAFLPMSPIKFSISADSQYLYANLDNDSITIFKLNWNLLLGRF